MPAYASLSYSATDNDGKYGLSDDRGQRWAVEFGSVIAPNFLLAVGYTHVLNTLVRSQVRQCQLVS